MSSYPHQTSIGWRQKVLNPLCSHIVWSLALAVDKRFCDQARDGWSSGAEAGRVRSRGNWFVLQWKWVLAEGSNTVECRPATQSRE